MKKLKLLSIIGALLFCAVINSRAQFTSYTNLIAPQTINGSATGSVFAVSAPFPSRYFQVLTGPITNAPIYVTNIVSGVTNVYNLITNSIATGFICSLNGSSNW